MQSFRLAIIVLLIIATPSSGLTLYVHTVVPDHQTGPFLNLTGSTSVTVSTWTETYDDDFRRGISENLVVNDGTILLNPYLEFELLNDGRPVLQAGSGSDWDSTLIGPTSFLKHDGTYYAYYHGSQYSSVADGFQIGLATSEDGVHWTKYSGNPIIRSGVDEFDLRSAWDPQVIVDEGTWWMYYAGMGSSINVCMATSNDGINWTKSSGNPILNSSLSEGVWNGLDVRPKGVFKEGGIYRMYLVGKSGDVTRRSMGLATSTDGVTWTYHQENPIYSASDASWYNGRFGFSSLERMEGSYRMWIQGYPGSWNVGWIRSEDGIEWEDAGGPVLTPGQAFADTRDIFSVSVIDEGDYYLLYALCENSDYSRTVACFRATPKGLNGEYMSEQFDAGGVVKLGEISWEADIPKGGNLDLFVRWGNRSEDQKDWMPIKTSDDIQGVTARYVQYRTTFLAKEDWISVDLRNVGIDYVVPIARVEVSVDDNPWQSVEGTFEDWSIDLILDNGSTRSSFGPSM